AVEFQLGGRFRTLAMPRWLQVLSSCAPCLTGNICCWVLYFFVYSIFGSRFPRGKLDHCPAAGVSWLTTGLRRFMPVSLCGSQERSAYEHAHVLCSRAQRGSCSSIFRLARECFGRAKFGFAAAAFRPAIWSEGAMFKKSFFTD